jgi:ribonuclease Z
MKFHFLGTGAGVPSRQRNVSSLAVVFPEHGGQTWLFDCGEATQHRILESPVKLNKCTRIFITHLHGDHLFGLPGLLASRSFQDAQTPLILYGPPGLQPYLEVALGVSQTFLRYPAELIEVEHGQQIIDEHFVITVGLLDHGVPSFGFRVEERCRPGELDVRRLRELGVPPGPVYKELKKGKTVRLDDGRILNGADFVGPPKPGRIFTVLGDTRPCVTALELARGSDLLIHESTYRAGQENLAITYFHSTCTQAAEIAREAGVRHLILTHISPRFDEQGAAELLEEARSIFPNTSLARDGWVYELARPERKGEREQ